MISLISNSTRKELNAAQWRGSNGGNPGLNRDYGAGGNAGS